MQRYHIKSKASWIAKMSQEIVVVNSFLRVCDWVGTKIGRLLYTHAEPNNIKDPNAVSVEGAKQNTFWRLNNRKVIVNGKQVKRVGVQLTLRFLVCISLKVTVFLVGCNGNWKKRYWMCTVVDPPQRSVTACN